MFGLNLSKPIDQYPCLRRFLAAGFEHRPHRDAVDHHMVCLETLNQTVFVNPETGYTRFGRTIAAVN